MTPPRREHNHSGTQPWQARPVYDDSKKYNQSHYSRRQFKGSNICPVHYSNDQTELYFVFMLPSVPKQECLGQ